MPILLSAAVGLAWLLSASGLSAATTSAQPPAGSGASGGSVLRLVSGIEGKEPGGPAAEAVPTPVPEADAFGVPSVIDGRPLWSSPDQAGSQPSQDDSGWLDWLPEGMLPIWGPRTPQVHRYTGRGEPLLGASWLNRPYHVDWFAGSFDGDEAIRGAVKVRTGFFGGYRFGCDYDYYWGWETRIGATSLGLTNLDAGSNVKLGTVEVVPWDVDLLYYPWGDARWRPYLLVGAGLTSIEFQDQIGRSYDEALFTVPFGFGLKVRCLRDWLALRLEMLDNLAIGSGGLDTMHNITLTGGVEVHFGGHRKSYWPWNPDRYLW